MFKKLLGAVLTAGAVAAGAKVVKDILEADAEEKNIIEIEDNTQPEGEEE